MIHPTRQHIVLLEDRCEFEIRLLGADVAESEVGTAACDCRQHLGCSLVDDADDNAWKALVELHQETRQEKPDRRRHAGDRHFAGNAGGHITDANQRLFQAIEQFGGPVRKFPPNRGQVNLARGAVEQAYAQRAFEFSHTPRQRRLRNMQFNSRRAKAAQLGDRNKRPKVGKVEIHARSVSILRKNALYIHECLIHHLLRWCSTLTSSTAPGRQQVSSANIVRRNK